MVLIRENKLALRLNQVASIESNCDSVVQGHIPKVMNRGDKNEVDVLGNSEVRVRCQML